MSHFIEVSCLLNIGAQIGQPRRIWNSSSERFLFGYRSKVSIFDLNLATFYTNRALGFVEAVVNRAGKGFFYGLSGHDYFTFNSYRLLGHVTSRVTWRGGFLTNTKKFRTYVRNFRKVPCFIVSFRFTHTNASLIREKKRIKVPAVTLHDSDTNPKYFEFPIPCGIRGSRAIALYFGQLFLKVLLAAHVANLRVIRKLMLRQKMRKFNRENKILGRKWNRTTTVSFSGLYSTVELSPFL
jgi:ribosomal protein S2